MSVHKKNQGVEIKESDPLLFFFINCTGNVLEFVEIVASELERLAETGHVIARLRHQLQQVEVFQSTQHVDDRAELLLEVIEQLGEGFTVTRDLLYLREIRQPPARKRLSYPVFRLDEQQ